VGGHADSPTARTHYTCEVTDLTETDVDRRVPTIAEERLVVLSRRSPVTVPPGTSLAECLRAIQRTGTGDSVFVCEDDGRLVGVLTERDIFASLVGDELDLGLPVETLMTLEPHTLDLDQTIHDAVTLMQTGRYRNVPIVDADGLLVGVIRQSDIIRYLAESFPEELLNLPPRPNQPIEESEGA
jgi:CBS domain-containing protein